MTGNTVPVDTGEDALEELKRARGHTVSRLQTAVEGLSPVLRRAAGFHFGWWDEHGRPTPGDGGKMVRPALAILCAEAVGGITEAAVPAAAAVEFAHNFSLLHDDVMDEDRTRRHRPTVWTVFGIPAAILAGDALLTLAVQALGDGGPRLATDGVSRLSAAVLRLTDGQAIDMAFEHRTDVQLTECVEMAGGKTASLMGCSCELGALAGDADPVRADRFRQFGEHLGLAFQLVDDLLGIWGDSMVTGKPVMADLRIRKKSLPVVAALTAGNEPGERLAAVYHSDEPLTEDDLETAAGLVEQAGGRRWAQAEVHRQLDEALSCLRAAEPEPVAAARLVSMARLLGKRDH